MSPQDALALVRETHPEDVVDVALRVHGFPQQWLVRDEARTVAFVVHAGSRAVNPVNPAVAIVTVEPGADPGVLGASWWRTMAP